MQIANQQTLSVSQQQAWDALNHIDVLQKAIPGCESLVETAPQQYEVHILAAVGPVKAKFKGKLRLSDLQPPASYRIDFEGQGGAAGHGKGNASVRLEPTSANTCVLHYEATATVGGKIAQIGQRLVDMAAQKMAGEFFQNFNAALEQLYPAPVAASPESPASSAPTPSPPRQPGWWNALRRWFARAFG
ncbi:MAG: CoxG family protein [Hydrogenophaga sp.]|jgi:carbon monoxide dehydrogenase subunit G|uniref:CoxG family protein n=1 Tax=Hydrogenophaga sp. TaxID=1904254 RepID=UPI001D75B5C8|nr:carbon monoxide dehydrogenase subunit G [Hydrogenophaga sp.]MBW0172390.1 carbon monoxide dehydrogenase subunit G [Hydrogenophaga sp.]MBW0182761.1 carbon monoxide dehydrogenase subunit G [Hydrogenophaga sp.]